MGTGYLVRFGKPQVARWEAERFADFEVRVGSDGGAGGGGGGGVGRIWTLTLFLCQSGRTERARELAPQQLDTTVRYETESIS